MPASPDAREQPPPAFVLVMSERVSAHQTAGHRPPLPCLASTECLLRAAATAGLIRRAAQPRIAGLVSVERRGLLSVGCLGSRKLCRGRGGRREGFCSPRKATKGARESQPGG